MKSEISVGSIIKDWEVIEKVESNKKYSYEYRCRCIKCGNTRTYNKYYLNEDNSLECSKCVALEVARAKYEEFKSMCQEDIPKVDNIDINKPYRLKCINGHTFISSLYKFKSCIICGSYDKINKNINNIIKNKSELEKYIYNRLNDIMEFDNEENDISQRLVSSKYMILINIICELDKKFNKEYHSSRSEFVRAISTNKKINDAYKSKGYIIWDVVSTGDAAKDIESVENTINKLISILDV